MFRTLKNLLKKLNKRNMKKKYLLIRLFIICLYLSITTSFAQGPPTPPNPDVPIDGGLSLLLAAGVGYGIKEVRNKQLKK